MSSVHKLPADHLYYTLNLRKGSHDQVNDFAPLNFQDIRNEPILNKCDDYEMSIVKFSVDTPSLPVFVPEIQPNQADPWRTIYSVTLSYTTGGVETFIPAPISVEYVQRDFTDFTPLPPNQNVNGVQSQTRAYYSYSYTDIVEDVNEALEKAKADLDILFPALAVIDPPCLVWDCDRGLANIYARLDSYEEGLADRINVYFSKSLYPLFGSFPVEKFSVNPNRADYRIRFKNNKTNILENFFGIQSALEICQEYSTQELFSPISSIAFTTNLIPAQYEYLSPPTVYENGSLQPQLDNLNNYFNIITDLTSQDNGYRANLLYLPTANFRFLTLFGNQPLYKLDFSVYLVLKNGKLIPFYLHSNASVLLKVLFRRKGSTYTP
jgi:hypothetical protein